MVHDQKLSIEATLALHGESVSTSLTRAHQPLSNIVSILSSITRKESLELTLTGPNSLPYAYGQQEATTKSIQ